LIDGVSATARFAELKYGAGELGLIGPSTWFDFAHHKSLRVEQISSFGLELGLIGFVFWGGAERNIGVNLWGKRGCVGFGAAEIGFVLHN